MIDYVCVNEDVTGTRAVVSANRNSKNCLGVSGFVLLSIVY